MQLAAQIIINICLMKQNLHNNQEKANKLRQTLTHTDRHESQIRGKTYTLTLLYGV